MYILNILYIIICIILLIIVLYPLNIYELISYSKVFDIMDILNGKFNDNIRKKIIIIIQNNLIKQQIGFYNFDFENNKFKVVLNNIDYILNINEINKIVPIIKLSSNI